MSAPLTIYECPNCGHTQTTFNVVPREHVVRGGRPGEWHAVPLVAVRVFREEDVRPLWEFCASLLQKEDAERQAMAAAFPAPDEWKTNA